MAVGDHSTALPAHNDIKGRVFVEAHDLASLEEDVVIVDVSDLIAYVELHSSIVSDSWL